MCIKIPQRYHKKLRKRMKAPNITESGSTDEILHCVRIQQRLLAQYAHRLLQSFVDQQPVTGH